MFYKLKDRKTHRAELMHIRALLNDSNEGFILGGGVYEIPLRYKEAYENYSLRQVRLHEFKSVDDRSLPNTDPVYCKVIDNKLILM